MPLARCEIPRLAHRVLASSRQLIAPGAEWRQRKMVPPWACKDWAPAACPRGRVYDVGNRTVRTADDTSFGQVRSVRPMMTRCECMELPFLGLMAYARRYNIKDIEELVAATRCCTGCGTCRPYVEELLKTGKLRCGDQLIELPKIDVPLDVPPPARSRDM